MMTRWFREERERDEGERPARDTTNLYSIRKMIAAEREYFFFPSFTLHSKKKEPTTRTKRRQRITAAKAHDAPW